MITQIASSTNFAFLFQFLSIICIPKTTQNMCWLFSKYQWQSKSKLPLWQKNTLLGHEKDHKSFVMVQINKNSYAVFVFCSVYALVDLFKISPVGKLWMSHCVRFQLLKTFSKTNGFSCWTPNNPQSIRPECHGSVSNPFWSDLCPVTILINQL